MSGKAFKKPVRVRILLSDEERPIRSPVPGQEEGKGNQGGTLFEDDLIPSARPITLEFFDLTCPQSGTPQRLLTSDSGFVSLAREDGAQVFTGYQIVAAGSRAQTEMILSLFDVTSQFALRLPDGVTGRWDSYFGLNALVSTAGHTYFAETIYDTTNNPDKFNWLKSDGPVTRTCTTLGIGAFAQYMPWTTGPGYKVTRAASPDAAAVADLKFRGGDHLKIFMRPVPRVFEITIGQPTQLVTRWSGRVDAQPLYLQSPHDSQLGLSSIIVGGQLAPHLKGERWNSQAVGPPNSGPVFTRRGARSINQFLGSFAAVISGAQANTDWNNAAFGALVDQYGNQLGHGQMLYYIGGLVNVYQADYQYQGMLVGAFLHKAQLYYVWLDHERNDAAIYRGGHYEPYQVSILVAGFSNAQMKYKPFFIFTGEMDALPLSGYVQTQEPPENPGGPQRIYSTP